jgi:hypothetical protein
MDDTDLFLELSALVTGVYRIVLDPEDKLLARPMAAQYARLLKASHPAGLPNLVEAYRAIRTASPQAQLDDQLLAQLQATQAFKDHEFVARQIVNIWFFSQYKDSPAKTAPFLDGGFYERGLAWREIKAHPIGFSRQPYGYWSRNPEGNL